MDATSRTIPAGGSRRAITLPRSKLVVLGGSRRGAELVLGAPVVRIGKAPGNDLVLPEATVSRHHCEILREGGRYLLRDLGSTNGTYLEGAEVREAYLAPGATIALGDVALRFQPFEEEIEILPSDREELGDLVGRSLAMREIFGLIERVAPTDATVLLQGETGTGKDLVARTIHELSPREGGPFVVVDCGAVAPTLIESEFFGHERGAFTGATSSREGAFERAHGGTLFLDELGELSLDLQPKLLRVLEQREVRRVGGNRTIPVDIRVIAATKQDLRAQVARGKFREDLYFRLSVVPIYLPPLRERREDVPLLARRIWERLGGRPEDLDQASLDALAAHEWPGNVRELRNVLEREIYLSRSGETGRPRFRALAGDPGGAATGVAMAFDPRLTFRENKERWNARFERRYLAWLMDRSGGNVSRAAREAGMDRKHLHRLLKKHGLAGREGG